MLQQEQDLYQDDTLLEDEIETRYLYIYEEDPEQYHWHWPKLDMSRIGNLCLQLLAIAMLAGFCVVQGQPISQVQTVNIPALLLPLQRFSASAPIVATGVKTIPARHARGMLTIYNGSILQEWLPAGFLVSTQSGIEIVTDQAVVIPAANLPAPGVATVPAHALPAGSQGNIAVDAIYQADGGDIVIKNLVPFTSGQEARTMHVVQESDREATITEAKARVEAEKPTSGLLARPCTETVQQSETHVTVRLDCQYVTYQIPAGARVLSARVEGKTVLVQLQTIVQPA